MVNLQDPWNNVGEKHMHIDLFSLARPLLCQIVGIGHVVYSYCPNAIKWRNKSAGEGDTCKHFSPILFQGCLLGIS